MKYKELQSPSGMIRKVDASKKKKIKNLLNAGCVDLNPGPVKVVKAKAKKK